MLLESSKKCVVSELVARAHADKAPSHVLNVSQTDMCETNYYKSIISSKGPSCRNKSIVNQFH